MYFRVFKTPLCSRNGRSTFFNGLSRNTVFSHFHWPCPCKTPNTVKRAEAFLACFRFLLSSVWRIYLTGIEFLGSLFVRASLDVLRWFRLQIRTCREFTWRFTWSNESNERFITKQYFRSIDLFVSYFDISLHFILETCRNIVLKEAHDLLHS